MCWSSNSRRESLSTACCSTSSGTAMSRPVTTISTPAFTMPSRAVVGRTVRPAEISSSLTVLLLGDMPGMHPGAPPGPSRTNRVPVGPVHDRHGVVLGGSAVAAQPAEGVAPADVLQLVGREVHAADRRRRGLLAGHGRVVRADQQP